MRTINVASLFLTVAFCQLSAVVTSDFDLERFVHDLDQNGYRVEAEFEFGSPLDEVWDVISDWSDFSWVLGPISATPLPSKWNRPTRRLNYTSGYTNEVLLDVNDEETSLDYLVFESSVLPYSAYKGSIKLSPNDEKGTTIFTYKAVFYPKVEAEGQRLKADLEVKVNSYIKPFLQKRFSH